MTTTRKKLGGETRPAGPDPDPMPDSLVALFLAWRMAGPRVRLAFLRWLLRQGLRELPPAGEA